MIENNATIIPLLPCVALDETLAFYQTLGFEVTYQQQTPYPYGAVRRGAIELHFANLRVYGAQQAFGAYLAFVDAVEPYHRAFADALRATYGRIPTAGLPRITRFTQGQTRFKVFDPAGNLVIYINRDEPERVYGASKEQLSKLAQAIENAIFLRDTYANDGAAAKVLDVALKRNAAAAPTLPACSPCGQSWRWPWAIQNEHKLFGSNSSKFHCPLRIKLAATKRCTPPTTWSAGLRSRQRA